MTPAKGGNVAVGFAANYYGGGSPGTALQTLLHNHDFGAFASSVQRETLLTSSIDQALAWTQVADDEAVVGMTVKDATIEPIIIMPKISRSAATYWSSWCPVVAGIKSIKLRPLVDLANVQDANLSVPFIIAASYDGITTAFQLPSTWVGGSINRDGSPAFPFIHVSIDSAVTHLRCGCILPSVLSMGLEATMSLV